MGQERQAPVDKLLRLVEALILQYEQGDTQLDNHTVESLKEAVAEYRQTSRRAVIDQRRTKPL